MGMLDVDQAPRQVLHGQVRHPVQRAGRPEGAARAGHRRGPGPAPAAQGAGGQRHRQPEAGRAAPQPRRWASTRSSTANTRQACSWPTRPHQAGDADQGRPSTTRAAEAFANRLDRARARDRRHQGAGPAVGAGRRAGQGGRAAERHGPAGASWPSARSCCSQLDQAKMQEQMNTAMASLGEAVGEDVPTLRRGPRQDRGPLRQGQGHGRAQREHGRATACSRSSRPSMNSEAQARLTEIRTAARPRRRPRPTAPLLEARRRRRRRRGRPRRGRGRQPSPSRLTAARSPASGRARRGRRGGRPRAATPSGSSACGARPPPRRRRASRRAEALGEHDAVGPGDLDRVVGVEVALARR